MPWERETVSLRLMSVTSKPSEKQSRLGTFGKVVAAFTATAVAGGVVAAGIAMPAVGAASAVANTAVASFEALPDDLTDTKLPQRIQILDRGGYHLAYLYSQNREVVPLNEISPKVQEAIIAVEDARFYEHNGIDVKGTLRAAVTNSGAGEVRQGGSTLTQQYVKMSLLERATTKAEQEAAVEQTVERKLREASYAISLEKERSKDWILRNYLNTAYFGAGAYGIEAASERYFSRPAAKLNWAQAATLAGIVQQPGAFDPLVNPKASQQRRNVVLQRLFDQGYIDAKTYKNGTSVGIKKTLDPKSFPNGCQGTDAPFFCDYVIQTLKSDPAFGKTKEVRQNRVRNGGFVVLTSLDKQVQQNTQDGVEGSIPIDDSSQKATAVTLMKVGTGEIYAMSQNREWGVKGEGRTTYNYNVEQSMGGTIGMQSGSTFKVFTMLAALERGISPYTTIESPPENVFTSFRYCGGYYGGEPYPVENYEGSPSGKMNMYTGAQGSVNTFFVALESQVDLCRQAEIAESMGVFRGDGDKLRRVPAFVLGANEITPLGLTGAYAAVANHGVYCEPLPILEIQSLHARKTGKTIEPNCREVISRGVADRTSDILVSVVEKGTGRPAQFGRPAAGKTGTTDDASAVWFAGYTPDFAAAVWVGDPRGGYRYPLRSVTINGTYHPIGYGSVLAAPVWKEAMIAAHDGVPVSSFDLQIPQAAPPIPTSTSSTEDSDDESRLP